METSFWWDVWSGPCSLKSAFPVLYRFSSKKFGSIKDFIVTSPSDESWVLSFSREIREAEIPMVSSLLHQIGNPPPTLNGAADSLSWTLTPKGSYTVKSFYDQLGGPPQQEYPYQITFRKETTTSQTAAIYANTTSKPPSTSSSIVTSPGKFGHSSSQITGGVGASPMKSWILHTVGRQKCRDQIPDSLLDIYKFRGLQDTF
ncbi:hypothetical protein BVC80_7981g6 [Macleaya cordata]|uniref:Uncharacterized protein n=1 Tax=Macleaya cordata TaxID=56857 RepID=A0A200PS89_MACCD|nr:hypothetical protein BVC80_7981g6 [Macleaya cordata]